VQVTVTGLAQGSYAIQPFDSWQGTWLEPFDIQCGNSDCVIALPDFKSDMAFKIVRK
jgi:hypothetical protein